MAPSKAICAAAEPAANGLKSIAGPASGAAADGDIIEMRFDASVAEALARLYSNPAAAIQEIMANAVTACKTARRLHGADAYIRIGIDGRNISIEDRDSLGMPWAVFRDVYARAGKSLKLGEGGGRLPGMFGCGSISYLLISDIMFIETHSRTTGERYSVMACDGKGFQTGLKEPEFSWHGTRIRMTIRKDIDLAGVYRRIADVAAMCGVRVVLDAKNASGEDLEESGIGYLEWCEAEVADGPDGMDLANEHGYEPEYPVSFRVVFEASTFAERSAAIMGPIGTDRNGAYLGRVRAENDDMEVVAQCRSPTRYGFDGPDGTRKTWLAGMPIGHAYKGRLPSDWDVWIHCKDEQKYRPTPDRERLPDDIAAKVDKEADALLYAEISRIRPASLKEYLADPSNRILELVPKDNYAGLYREAAAGMGKDVGICDRPEMHHLDIAKAAARVVCSNYNLPRERGSTIWSMLERDGSVVDDDGRALEPYCDPQMQLIVAERYEASRAAAVIAHALDNGQIAIVFSPHPKSGLAVRDYVSLGCEPIEEYMRRSGIKDTAAWLDLEAAERDEREQERQKRRRRLPGKCGEFVAHSGKYSRSADGTYVPSRGSERLEIDGEYETKTIVRCMDTGSFEHLRSVLVALPCSTYATSSQECARGTEEFERYAEDAGRAEYETSAGRISGADIAGDGRRAVLVEYGGRGDPAGFAGLLGRCDDGDSGRGRGALYVVDCADRLVACSSYLWKSGAKFGVWMLPFYSKSGKQLHDSAGDHMEAP